MVNDGLWDVYHNQHMGDCAELCAREKSFPREEQDRFAVQSYAGRSTQSRAENSRMRQ